jgi:hypothetical protein
MTVYTITVIDVATNPVIGIRRTPAIFQKLSDAIYAVKNNEMDMSDDGHYQFAVIEETHMNTVYPNIFDSRRMWFKYNSITQEYEECQVDKVPHQISRLSGFGIG